MQASNEFDMGFNDAVNDELQGTIADEAQTVSSILSVMRDRHTGKSQAYWGGYANALREEFQYPE
jgi:hypothetical protein